MISDDLYLRGTYWCQAKIDFGAEWISNPAKLGFLPHPLGSRVEDQRHERWLNFLNNHRHYFLADRLLKNDFSLDKWQKIKIINGLDFDIVVKGIDKVEQDYLPKIQKLPEKKDTYDRLKLREIFDLQKTKNFLVDDDQSDPWLSWLKGTTLDEKFDYFLQRKKEENFLETLDKIPKGRVNHLYIYWMNNNIIHSR